MMLDVKTRHALSILHWKMEQNLLKLLTIMYVLQDMPVLL